MKRGNAEGLAPGRARTSEREDKRGGMDTTYAIGAEGSGIGDRGRIAHTLLMCGRFTYRLTWPEIVRLYRLPLDTPARNTQARYNVCPTDPIDVVTQRDDRLELVSVRLPSAGWSYHPSSDSLSHASAFDQPCSWPHSGQLAWLTMEGSREKLSPSHQMPVEISFPVAGHLTMISLMMSPAFD